MLFKIEPSGETHAKDPLLGDDEIIVCSNAQEEVHVQKVANKMFFLLLLEGCERQKLLIKLEALLGGPYCSYSLFRYFVPLC